MILDIKFELNIAPTMHFIGHYLYGMKVAEFNPALRAKNLHAKFKRVEEGGAATK